MGAFPSAAAQAPKFDPLEQYAKLQQIKSQMQGQQIQGQQIQENQIDLQMKQRQQADQQTIMQTAAKYNGNLSQALPELAGKISAQSFIPLQKSILDTQKSYAELDEKNLANEKSRADQLLGLIDQAGKLPPDQYAAQWPQIAQQAGAIDPRLKNHVDPTQPIPQQSLPQLALGFATHSQLASMEAEKRANAEEQRKAAMAPSQLAESQANAKLKTNEANALESGGAVPGISLDVQEANSWLKQNPGKTLADYKKYSATLVPAFNFNLQANGVGGGQAPTNADGSAKSYDDAIKSFGGKSGVVKAIIEGRQSPPGGFAQKTPYWQDVMQKVYAVDPEFSEQRAQLRKSYTVGPQSKEINAINTAMGHVGVLGDAIDALNNGDIKALNRIGNVIGVQVGNDKVTAFNTIVHRVGPELSKAYIGAGGSAGERGADEKDFDPNLGPQQLKSNVSITAKLLRSKIGALENQWDQNKAPGMKSFADQFVTPEAKKQLDKWSPAGGAQGGGGKPAGATHTGRGSVDGKLHYLDAKGKDLGLAE